MNTCLLRSGRQMMRQDPEQGRHVAWLGVSVLPTPWPSATPGVPLAAWLLALVYCQVCPRWNLLDAGLLPCLGHGDQAVY